MKLTARVKLTLLGDFQAQLGADAPLALPTRKTQALLAYLALPLGQAHSRDKLATLLWGDMPDAQARGNLRHALSRIRKTPPAGARHGLILDGPTVALDPSVVDVDVAQFERMVADGQPPALEQIGGLYRGDLLAGLALTERPFEEWLTSERERLHELAIQALGRLLTHQQRAGAAEPAVQTGLRLLALDPLQEPVHRTLMRLYARLGRREAALRQYQLCVDALKRELSTSPEAETNQLYQEILRSRSSRPDRATVAAGGDPAPGPTADLLSAAVAALPEAPAPTNLPAPTSELIGRAAALAEVTELLGVHRLVTLIGAGGIGKTRLGLEVARRLLPDFTDGVWVAELAPLSDPGLVPVTVAVALGVTLLAGAESPERVAAALGAKRVLLMLDNCEHVIEEAARMAEALLRANPHARVMATSREPLRAPGEYVYRVLPLEVPAEGAEGREALLNAAAVQLFVARAQAVELHFALDARTAAITGAVCRRLDGIPLAIELAAARTAALGLEELAARLDDRFRLLTGGHRTALPRHQTLRATLDWSNELLPAIERTVLRRLAILVGGFTLEAASAVATAADLGAPEVVDSVTNLAAKSLVVVEVVGAVTRYRLLETTRAYALEKLTESGELEQVARHHAEYYRDLFERAEVEWETRPTLEWVAAYGRQIDNVRAALDWAFSPGGDASIGAALTAASVPLWFQYSLMLECRGRVERALASLEPRSGRGGRREMQLFAALGVSLMQTKGPAPDTTAAWTTALEIAERLDDIEYQLRALWGLWHFRVSLGECRAALALAESFCGRVAGSDNPAELLVGERMVGVSLHYLGDQANARRHLERMLSRYVTPAHRSHAIRFQYDQQVAARMILARILWLQGFPDQALRTAQENVEDARAIDHALSLCYALEAACLVPLWIADLPAAERSVAMLLDHSARHALTVWHARGRCLNGVLLIKRGEIGGGLPLLRGALEELGETGFVPHHTALLGTLALGLAGRGEIAQGLATIDEALARSERDEEYWCIAELLRIKGELVMLAGGSGAGPAAEGQFQQALDWARRQGALSLELRGATGLAGRWHGRGQTGPARELLAPVYGQFTEGFDTADLRAAKALLDQLG
ncbi:MAG TPA: BTAD domain-containing putative transcriptional regulator [Methylomirabilota bacterium]|nr:BTAD domain-containing putative transcriptional regulator [Methylomirabilota bacterium]